MVEIHLISKVTSVRCTIQESIILWAQSCLSKDHQANFKETYISYKDILFQSDFDSLNELKGVLSESCNATVLDSSGSKTVTARSVYIATLITYQKIRGNK